MWMEWLRLMHFLHLTRGDLPWRKYHWYEGYYLWNRWEDTEWIIFNLG